MIRAVIFDMDGVLVDSEPWYLEFFREFIRKNGREPDEELLLKTIGASNRETWRLVGQMWDPEADPAEVERIYRTRPDARYVQFQEAAFPGMQKALSSLASAGLRLLIASASSRKSVVRMTEETGIAPFIHAIVSGEQVKESKPAPDVYLRAIELSGVPKEECIAVEDSAYGVMAGHAAGIPVVGVDSRLVPGASDGADFRIRDVSEMPQFLMNHFGTQLRL